MPNIDSVPPNARVKMLQLADPGMGKTSAIASLANAGYKVRLFDFDGNLRVLANYLNDQGKKNLSYVSFPIVNDIPDVGSKSAREFDDLIMKGWNIGDEKFGKIDTWGSDTVVVLDTLTMLGELLLRHFMLVKKLKPDQTQAMSQEIWGLAQTAAKGYINYLCGPNIKAHLIVNTHVRYLEDDLGKTKAYPVVVGRALSSIIGRNFTDIVQIDAKNNGERFYRTSANSYLALRTSAPAVVKPEEPFDLAALFKKLGATV